MIYRLQEHNLVTFIRKKDNIKGWFIYYWTFDTHKAVALLIDIKQKSINSIKSELLQIGNKRHYYCEACRKKFTEEEALESQFLCETCGELLKEQDAEKRSKDLLKKLKKDEEELKIASEAMEEQRIMIAKDAEKAAEKEKIEKDLEKAEKKKELKKNQKEKTSKIIKKPHKKHENKKQINKKINKKKKNNHLTAEKKSIAKKVHEKKENIIEKKDSKEEKKKKGILQRVFRR